MAQCRGRTSGVALLPKAFHFPKNYVLLSTFIYLFSEKIETVYNFSRDTIESIIYFSDLHPEGLNESLRALPSTTTQLGLIAASTHFISGRPVTLYRDGSFFSDGAVGVALLKEKTNEKKMVSAHVDFLGIRRLSGSLTVTRWAITHFSCYFPLF